MKLDAHQHFWKFNPAEYAWIDERMHILKRDFLPADLAPELASLHFDGTIAVQARQSLEETHWLLKLADENPFIRGVVGWVDLRSDEIEKQLEAISLYAKLVGVRHVIHDEPDIDFMLGKEFIHGISLLKQYGLCYDLLLFPDHLQNARQLVSMFPDQVFVLDHISKPLIKHQILSPWDELIQNFADLPNVYCKLSGMVTEANWQSWTPADFTPYLDVVFEAFGPDRLMIGSDWPVCMVAGDYGKVMGIVMKYLEKFDEEVRMKVLGENCRKVYLKRVAER
ncbi:MAG: amidohydrolase family protein [Bacteroidales bacterium]|nr:amidohydrolase family protein [Bacteroidales bacterium]